ncbi:helix-turn-helix domain-containing protein [Citrobacter braakii]|uniref:helix-turn-helix domain-containing protein n=1 Tax=Citrobacter braakii TaxID=57706 RepID=UPI0039791902
MFVAEDIVKEIINLPCHSKANIIITIDKIISGACKENFVYVDDGIFYLITITTKVPYTIFIVEYEDVRVLIGIMRNTRSKISSIKREGVVFRARSFNAGDQLLSWRGIKNMLLDDKDANHYYEVGMLNETLSRLLVQWRVAAGLSKDEVARNLNVSYSYLSQLERNPSRASVITIRNYAKICGINELKISL